MTVKEMRTATGMTQKAFSEYLCIPKRTIQDWEGDRRTCPVYILALIEYKLRKDGLILDAPDLS